MSTEIKNEETTLENQNKQEVTENGENTTPGKYYRPATDITESDSALFICMDIPGVPRENVQINLEKNLLNVDAKIDTSLYENLDPAYSEYNVGHFTRTFKLSNNIDQNKIEASVTDGVLTLSLPKAPELQPRKIQIR